MVRTFVPVQCPNTIAVSPNRQMLTAWAGLCSSMHSRSRDEKSLLSHTTHGIPAGAQGLGRVVQQAAAAAIKEKGSFTLVLSGGSLLKGLSALVGSKSVEYSKWHIFYVDERNVPHSHPDSTHKGAVEAFLSKVDIPQQQVGCAWTAARLHKVLQGISLFWACLQCSKPRDMHTPGIQSRNCCCSAALD